jgi:hypothetical protein
MLFDLCLSFFMYKMEVARPIVQGVRQDLDSRRKAPSSIWHMAGTGKSVAVVMIIVVTDIHM